MQRFDKGSFLVVPNKNAIKGLRPNLQVVMMWLADYGLTSWPSQETLARKCGLSKSTLIRCLNDLEQRGLIAKDMRFGSGGMQTTNAYRIILRDSNGGDNGGDANEQGGCQIDTPGVSNLHTELTLMNSPNSLIEPKGSMAPERSQRSLDIDACFDSWASIMGIPVSRSREERMACNSLLNRKDMDVERMTNLIRLVRASDSDRYKRFSISGFCDLRANHDRLLTWAREKRAQQAQEKKQSKRTLSLEDIEC